MTLSDRETAPRDETNNLYLYLITLVAAVGGFLFGYDLSLISGAIIFLKAEFTLSPFWFGAVTGSAILGCPFGPLAGVWLADTLGRNKTLVLVGRAVHGLDDRQRLAHGHDRFQRLAIRGRDGRGAGLDRLADVHRRGRAGPAARTAGRGQPIGDRHRAVAVGAT